MLMGKGIQNNKIKKSYENEDNLPKKSPFVKEPTIVDHMQHSNVLDKTEMRDKSLNMLQDRYSKGLIDIDEFNEQCKKLSNQYKDQ